MTILSDRWKGFRKIPHVPLARLPTPVERSEALGGTAKARLWVKRDDESGGDRYGGNKVRKLEYVIAQALKERADTLLTAGAAGSHHVAATGHYAGLHGLEVHAVMFGQPHTAHVEAQLRESLAQGVRVHPVRSGALVPAALAARMARLRFAGKRALLVPPGGSSVAGVIGHVEAGLELARQLEAGQLPEPDTIFVPYGSGGTAAGLAVGLAASGVTSRIVAVRVVDRALASRRRLRGLVAEVVGHLRALDPRFPDVENTVRLEIDGTQLGKGYGRSTLAAEAASRRAAEAGLRLDATYTAKAFAGLLAQVETGAAGREILFVHTLGGADLEPRSNASRLPAELERLLAH